MDSADSSSQQLNFGGPCRKAILFIILLLANVLGPLSTEAQVPALQEIASDLNTSSKWVQLSITLYMLFFGASQLIFGSLSDVYGRRHTLLAGLIIYTLTNIGCALSPNVWCLNIFRCFQAMGSGTCMVVPNAIATDVFSYKQRTRALAALNSLRVVIIVASPLYGGLVATFLGWRYIFWIIGALSVVLIIATFLLLPETQSGVNFTAINDITDDMNFNNIDNNNNVIVNNNNNSITSSNSINYYSNNPSVRTISDYYNTLSLLIKHRVFVGLMLISGFVYAGVFIMFNEFSFVMSKDYNHTTFEVTLLFGFVILGLMIGSVLSAFTGSCMNPKMLIGLSVFQIILCGGVLITPFLMYNKLPSQLWTLLPLCLYVASDGLMMAPLLSTAVEPFRQQAGTANALSLFWRFFCGSLLALLISFSSNKHLYVLHFGMAAMAVLSGFIFMFILYPAQFPLITPKNSQNNLLLSSSSSNNISSRSLSFIKDVDGSYEEKLSLIRVDNNQMDSVINKTIKIKGVSGIEWKKSEFKNEEFVL